MVSGWLQMKTIETVYATLYEQKLGFKLSICLLFIIYYYLAYYIYNNLSVKSYLFTHRVSDSE